MSRDPDNGSTAVASLAHAFGVVSLAAAVVMAAGCSAAVRHKARVPTVAEIDLLQQAVRPLLGALGNLPAELNGPCPIEVGVVESPSINAGVSPGRPSGRCTALTLIVTEGLLRRLPLPMLRAVLAHELAHVQLGHLAVRKDHEPAARIRRLVTAFDRRQEADADRVAVGILRRLEPTYPDACIALVYVLAVLAEPPSGTAWLASHPSPDNRVDAVVRGCNRD